MDASNGIVSISVTGDVLIEIGRERERQRGKLGWTNEHDDDQVDGVLVGRANSYAFRDYEADEERRANLIKAASLIVAAIERLDRHQTKEVK